MASEEVDIWVGNMDGPERERAKRTDLSVESILRGITD